MRILEKEGRLRRFSNRSKKNDQKIDDRKNFMGKGEQHKEVLATNKQNVFQRINEKVRAQQEYEKEREEMRRKGRENGEFYWTGDYTLEYSFHPEYC